jgi:hypothetical protein
LNLGQSRILVAPGLRTAPHVGWRSGVGTAFAVVIGRPSLWLIGALGFTLRGGILILLLPIFVLPTPVEARLLLGTNLGSTGLTQSFLSNLGLAAGLLIIPIAFALLAIAYLELAAFERVVSDEETADQREDRPPGPLSMGQRRRLISWLAVVQLAAVILLAAAAVPLANAVIGVTTDEILRPTVADGSIYLRVLGGVREPLAGFLAAVVVVEMLTALVSRQLLMRGFTLHLGRAARRRIRSAPAAALARVFRNPLRTVGTAILGWALSLAVLMPVVWSLRLAWETVRSTYLATGSQTDTQSVTGLVLVTVALAAVFVAGVLLCGLASALRSGLWTLDGLRRL